MAEHTPLPWTIGGGKYLPINATTRDGKLAQIGRLESFGQISDEEVEANAEFLDAAVHCHNDMLEALKNWFECADEHDIPCRCGRDKALAAIAKAEGRNA